VQAVPRTAMRALGAGTAAFLGPQTLGAGKTLPTADVGLADQWVVVAGNTSRAFRITSNSSSAVFTDPGDGSMLEVGAAGSPYQGAFVLDGLTVRRAGFLDTGGNLIILAGGEATVAGGILIAPAVVRW
jgi:hypothetical protein